MEIKELLEGNNLNSSVVKASMNKSGVILSAGAMKTMKDGTSKFCLLIEFNGRQLNYTPNKISLDNIAKKHGTLTESWVGKTVSFSTMMMQNAKEGVVATPL